MSKLCKRLKSKNALHIPLIYGHLGSSFGVVSLCWISTYAPFWPLGARVATSNTGHQCWVYLGTSLFTTYWGAFVRLIAFVLSLATCQAVSTHSRINYEQGFQLSRIERESPAWTLFLPLSRQVCKISHINEKNPAKHVKSPASVGKKNLRK